MGWSGSFCFGEAYAAYFGPSDDNDLHQHAAYQIVLSATNAATVLDGNGIEWSGGPLLVKPLVMHAVHSNDPVSLIYLDPQSALALDLLNDAEPADIVGLPATVLPINGKSSPSRVMDWLNSYSRLSPKNLDSRLKDAIARLGEEPGRVSLSETARICGISESRLRTLAREQLGVPLSTWLIWRKLERAARDLAEGESLGHAALAGGFSDQAHFTRSMRRMFGVTPKEAARSLAGKGDEK